MLALSVELLCPVRVGLAHADAGYSVSCQQGLCQLEHAILDRTAVMQCLTDIHMLKHITLCDCILLGSLHKCVGFAAE